jgi:hypothetical protein
MTICHLLQPSCSTTFSHQCKVPHQQLGRLFHPFFLTWCHKRSCQAQLHPSNRGRWFHVWRLFVQQAHGYDNQWNLALMEAGVVSKMQTPAIPLWFPKKWLFIFFILEKQLSSQYMFLVKSKLSITTYLFLVFYKSTSLLSRSFFKKYGDFSVEVEIGE